jgi:hypothetical protein
LRERERELVLLAELELEMVVVGKDLSLGVKSSVENSF